MYDIIQLIISFFCICNLKIQLMKWFEAANHKRCVSSKRKALSRPSQKYVLYSVYQGFNFVRALVVRPGVGNPFGFAGQIRDKLGIRGPVHAL